MKLCNFLTDGEVHVGVEHERGVVDITRAGISETMNQIIAGGADTLQRISRLLEENDLPGQEERELTYACVTKPGKIVCVGLNYKSHAEETGGQAPEHPVLFSKFNDALCPTGREVVLPAWQRCYDYEAELVIVIGRTAWNVGADEAMDYVFGYTCGNDLSARDCQFVSNQWLIGKTFPDFAPAGPFIVTADSFDPNGSNHIFCELNGKIVQAGNTNDMIFSCREIVQYASRYCRLEPGDLIFTGTPAGVILGHKKGTRVWLKPGDTVKIMIDGICTLENKLISE
jgi:2-keto-4-pentenoate hydratase/2-oxohepta-3-ene-1,7-dioic acid hydratase in catechol pathway